ncbi:MAG: DUF4127 family protein [Phascolarctobacterium sp.]|nr:DUF4127 family protein [Phascolarctobacterium sp.]
MPSHNPVPLPALPVQDELLLVPLDSRPVCSTMVQKLGRLAGINVIVPPKELLDNYQEPADRKNLWLWLQKEAPSRSTNIISADILLHGSLLQTRQHVASEAEQDEFFKELGKLQKQIQAQRSVQAPSSKDSPSAPQFTLFSIIPRLLVSDDIYPDCWYQWHLMRYSQLLDMVQINGDYAMTKELEEYRKEIPAEILNKYTSIFTQSQGFNEKLLASLTPKAKNSLPSTAPLSYQKNDYPAMSLIIGQDDSSPFGLPKITTHNLERHIQQQDLENKAQITYGADEIGALLLARHYLEQISWKPKVYLQFASPKTEFKNMPYMATSTGACLRNQAQLVGAQLVATPKDADIVLFVHCGDDDAKPTASEAGALKQLLATGKQVALIDLSANFEAEEMLLPELLKRAVPVNQLAAYAGWNTFSNSSGTALAQSVIFAGRLRELRQHEAAQSFAIGEKPTNALQATVEQASSAAVASLYAANLNFTVERMLEDYYYQKCIHPKLRPYLESFGTTPTDLEPEEKTQTEYRIQERLALYADLLYWCSLNRTPFYADAHDAYYLDDLKVGAKLPWNRIFEVDLNIHSKVSVKPLQQ